MKTATDINESELEKARREALDWLERKGRAVHPFIHLAVENYGKVASHPEQPQEQDPEADIPKHPTSYRDFTMTEPGKELFEKVYIRDEKDLPKEVCQCYFHDSITGDVELYSCPSTTRMMQYFIDVCDWYLKPLK